MATLIRSTTRAAWAVLTSMAVAIASLGTASSAQAAIHAPTTPVPFLSVQVLSRHVAWAVAADGPWTSDDGGRHWTRRWPQGADATLASWQLSALNPDVAWAVGDSEVNASQDLFVTSDGGRHWRRYGLPMVGVTHLDVVTRQAAYIVCEPQGGAMGTTWYQLWRTNDDGRTWSLVASDSSSRSAYTESRSERPSLPSGFGPTGIAFATAQRGLICQTFTPRNGDACQMTLDGGRRWAGIYLRAPQAVRRLPPYEQVVQAASAPILASSRVIYVVVAYTPTQSAPPSKATGLALYRTSDGGRSWRLAHWFSGHLWRPVALQSFGSAALRLAFATPRVGVAFAFVGSHGTATPVRALATRDGGEIWHQSDWPPDWTPAGPPTFSSGGKFGLVLIRSRAKTYLAASNDGGRSWHPVPTRA